MKTIERVCVVGAGTMGRQIALSAAIYGFQTYARCYDEKEVAAVQEWSESYLAGRIKKGRLTEDQVALVKKRFHLTSSYEEAISGADLIIEAVLEIEDLKREVLTVIGKLAKDDAIIATNSSYMVSSSFIECVPNPSRLCNLHYFNPALVMKLVEVAQGEHTSEETALTLVKFCKDIGKTPVRIRKEIDGLLANRILRAITDEAMYLVENGYCTFEDLDIACENGLNHPIGPFKLADMAGIDLRYFAAQKRYEDTGVKPAGFDLYQELYEKGEYGRKTGKGFYSYEKK